MLAQFAQLGSAYAEVAFGITSRRVGLLSIGAEPGKGNKLAKRAYELLTAEAQLGPAPINFVGNVEGCDLLASKVDVIVTEGFTGNVALKTMEETARFTASQFRSALGGSAGPSSARCSSAGSFATCTTRSTRRLMAALRCSGWRGRW